MRGARRPPDVRVQEPAHAGPGLRPSGPARPRGLRDLDEIDLVFKALAHPARRHILQVLHARNGTMTAGELAARFSHSWPTTTRHLGVLTAAGLIEVEAHGRERHYLLDRKHLRDVSGLWFGSIDLLVSDAPDSDDPATP